MCLGFIPAFSGAEISVAADVGECGIGFLPSLCLAAAALQWGNYPAEPGTQ